MLTLILYSLSHFSSGGEEPASPDTRGVSCPSARGAGPWATCGWRDEPAADADLCPDSASCWQNQTEMTGKFQ